MHGAGQEEHQEDMHDIVIFCSSTIIDDLTSVFHLLMHEHTTVDVLWSGGTRRYGMGIIVLECEGVLPEALQRELDTNKRITDYVMYEVPTYVHIREGEKQP